MAEKEFYFTKPTKIFMEHLKMGNFSIIRYIYFIKNNDKINVKRKRNWRKISKVWYVILLRGYFRIDIGKNKSKIVKIIEKE